MLNEKPTYKVPAAASSANTKAICLLIAAAVLLVTAPIGFLLAKGWLSPGGEEEDALTVGAGSEYADYYDEAPADGEETAADPSFPVATVTDGSIGEISTPVADGGSFAPDVESTDNAPAAAATGDNGTSAPAATANDGALAVPGAAAVATGMPSAPPPPPTVAETTTTAANVTATAPAPTVTAPAVTAPAATAAAKTAPAAAKPAERERTPPKREFKALTKEEMSKLKQANSESKNKSSGVSQNEKDQYNRKLYSFVRSNWNAPAPDAVNGKKLKVVIVVSVSPNGTVTEARIKTPSYVKAMDESVRKLCDKLKKSKAPAPGFQTGPVPVKLEN